MQEIVHISHKTEYEVSEEMTVGAFFAFLERKIVISSCSKEMMFA